MDELWSIIANSPEGTPEIATIVCDLLRSKNLDPIEMRWKVAEALAKFPGDTRTTVMLKDAREILESVIVLEDRQLPQSGVN